MSEKSFEKSLAELEKIVEKMEEGGLSLNESLSLFEKGVKLARFLRELQDPVWPPILHLEVHQM